MKNLYATLILVFCSFISNAQIVNIPDINFKNKLLNYSPVIDTNNDGEIQESEALVITYLDVTYLSISNMTGIEAFTNLITLICSHNFNLNSINVSSLVNLKSLVCSHNELNSINISNLLNLTLLDCSYNYNLNNIDVSNLVNLESLNCSDNNLSTLDVSTLVSLKSLNCGNTQEHGNLNPMGTNHLSTLNVSNCINLESLTCSHNQITELDVTNSNKLHIVKAGFNLFTILDFSNYEFSSNYINNGLTFYELWNNPNLISVNFKNGAPVEINPDYTSYSERYFNVLNCNNLQYICCNEFNLNQISCSVNAQINSYCSFNPGGNYNTITGTFSFDNDNNGCDDNDFKFPNRKIKINDVSNIFGATYSNASGNYNFFTQSGNFIITPEFENPYFTVSPASATITFADSNNNTQTQNFCVTPNGVHNDLEVSVLPIQRPRPGFDATYQLTYKNKGNQVLSGNVNLAFNDAVLDFVSANPGLSNQSLNTLSWSYSNLLPFESRTINFTLNVNSPQEIPAVNIGDILNFSASIDPIAGDETINDNTFALAQTVFGSYDPNDKTCLEGNTIVPERIGEYLHYLIRFQNSGTAAAENIVVKDIIDTTKFDITSLQLTSASHDYKTKITGDKVEFIFENINLPAEIDNEAASHGFVAFKIKTKNNLITGNSVSNKADIYFDYNFPIATNPAVTTFATLGMNQIENKSIAVYPNPVNDILTISSKGTITSIQLLDVQGRLVATYLESEEKATINLRDKTSGVYFVKIYTENGVKLEKIVKK